eukprot:9154750-Pyramimonas_sp.AAC.1
MLTYVGSIEERVGVFTVVKNLSKDVGCQVESSRLAWDCRRLNLKFRKPSWTGLGSPSAPSSLDLPRRSRHGGAVLVRGGHATL